MTEQSQSNSQPQSKSKPDTGVYNIMSVHITKKCPEGDPKDDECSPEKADRLSILSILFTRFSKFYRIASDSHCEENEIRRSNLHGPRSSMDILFPCLELGFFVNFINSLNGNF